MGREGLSCLLNKCYVFFYVHHVFVVVGPSLLLYFQCLNCIFYNCGFLIDIILQISKYPSNSQVLISLYSVPVKILTLNILIISIFQKVLNILIREISFRENKQISCFDHEIWRNRKLFGSDVFFSTLYSLFQPQIKYTLSMFSSHKIIIILPII